jgi:two-component system cell cycle response regulator
LRVLIAEDDPVTQRLLEVFLRKWGYDVQITSNGSEALEELKKPKAPSLVLSDWMMPGIDGLELCREIRALGRLDYVYFIILTAKGKKEDVVEGLEAGADDYLVKPFDQEELKYRVKIGERILNLERRISQLARTDELTGVLNRRALFERIHESTHRAVREDSPFCLLMADLDHFKKINDHFGHQAGDIVLQQFIKKLLKISRPYDFIGRYGGEEFVVCFPGVRHNKAENIAERMREGIETLEIKLPNNAEPIRITASFGLACYDIGSEESVDSLINRADEAMYQAKQHGRNRVHVSNKQ